MGAFYTSVGLVLALVLLELAISAFVRLAAVFGDDPLWSIEEGDL